MNRAAPTAVLAAVLTVLLGSPAHAYVAPWGDGTSDPEDLSVLLVTFGPGRKEDVASWFGHTALVVEDRKLRHARLYNYGMFTFDSKMLARFAMGRLEFWVGEADVRATLDFYRAENRDVRLQELNFTPEQRGQIAKALADNVLPQNREYLYHHYDDNCSTRPRDMIDRAIGGALTRATNVPARMTLREHTRRHTAVFPPMSLLLDFLMNDEIDRPILQLHEAFLPEELEAQVDRMTLTDATGATRPLVARKWTYFDSPKPPPPATPPNYLPWTLLLGMFLGGIAVLSSFLRSARAARIVRGLHASFLGFFFGLFGTVLFVMWSFTEHTVTWRNENLFLANPGWLALIPLGFSYARGKNPRTAARLRIVWLALAAFGALGLALKVIPLFNQDNWRLIAMILPVSLGGAAAFLLDVRQKRTATSTATVGA